jgi:hypothetical protein
MLVKLDYLDKKIDILFIYITGYEWANYIQCLKLKRIKGADEALIWNVKSSEALLRSYLATHVISAQRQWRVVVKSTRAWFILNALKVFNKESEIKESEFRYDPSDRLHDCSAFSRPLNCIRQITDNKNEWTTFLEIVHR